MQTLAGSQALAGSSSSSSSRSSSSSWCRGKSGCSHAGACSVSGRGVSSSSGRSSVQAQASKPQQAAPASNFFQRFGRVLRDKAANDIDLVFRGASKTRERLSVVDELLGIWNLDDYEATLEELEEALISADFGPKTALKVVDRIRDGIKIGRVKTADDTRVALKAAIVDLLKTGNDAQSGASSSELRLSSAKPAVVLVVGVNGSGKTTTIGKLAYKLSKEGAKVFLIPGDTFRAAAAEQLMEWGRRANVTVGAFQDRAKPQKVIAEGCQAALKDGSYDIVICDTAGRLHTAYALMEELEACKVAIGKTLGYGQPDEVLLVLDGTTGLNMLNQAREFNDTVKLTGLILTKLDGSARGGAVVSVVDQLRLPIKFVGVGETQEDLQPFNAETFAEALFPKKEQQ